MIGVLLITHGAYGEALLHSASHVLGRAPDNVALIGVSSSDSPDAVFAQVRAKVRALDTGAGVLVLMDMFGATPCNVAARVLEPGRIEGVAGVNLPMLVRVLGHCADCTLQSLVGKAQSGGTEGVVHVTDDCCNDAKR